MIKIIGVLKSLRINMAIAVPFQKIQDWITQQWVILFGKKIYPEEHVWLFGPFGKIGGIGEQFILQLAEKENLIIRKNATSQGLLNSIHELNLSSNEMGQISSEIIRFYENTSDHQLSLSIQWNPFFRIFGIGINRLFSNRINQLNIPTHTSSDKEVLTSQIIQLIEPKTNRVKYTIWLRKNTTNDQVMYSGIYGTTTLPSGKKCIKAIFPLPNGNATVIMTPSVNEKGSLKLDASGKKFGDAGFYFLLHDSKGRNWSKYVRAFRDQLELTATNNKLFAKQELTLWKKRVLTFHYEII